MLDVGNHQCCLCGSTEKLTVDHIKPRSVFPELFYEVSNGRVLCEKCRVRDMLEGIRNGAFRRSR